MSESVDAFALLKSQVVLSEYVSPHTTLNKTGKSGVFRGACPIHGGDNKSAFQVNDRMGVFVCFNCGAKGSVIDFEMAMHNRSGSAADLTEALNNIAAATNVVLPESKRDVNEISASRLTQALREVCEDAHDYLLRGKDEEAREARAYLKSRGLTRAELEDWMLGVLPEPDYAVDQIQDASADTAALLEIGVLGKSGATGKLYSPISGRILFPIFSAPDRLVSIGARIFMPTGERRAMNEGAKYYNLPASRIYDKSKVLYGMHKLKKHTERAIIIEGYLDAIAVDSLDVGVAVATCGTALTPEQVDQLRECGEVIEMFDADTAGRKALASAMWTVNRLGDKANAVTLDGGKDAFELSRNDPDSLVLQIEGREPLVAKAVQERYAIATSDAEFDAWVAQQTKILQRQDHQDALLRTAQKLRNIQGGVTNYARELSLANVRAVRDREVDSDEEIQIPLDPGMLSLMRRLMQMSDADRDACLTTLSGWSASVEDAVRTWFPVSTDLDLAALARLAAGHGKGPSVGGVDQALAEAMAVEDEVEDISMVLRRMIKLMRYDMTQLPLGKVDPSLRNGMLALRRADKNISDLDKQPDIFVFLADLAIDMQRTRVALEV